MTSCVHAADGLDSGVQTEELNHLRTSLLRLQELQGSQDGADEGELEEDLGEDDSVTKERFKRLLVVTI